MINKREKGQYFTITNPFDLNVFKQWLKNIPNLCTVLEPFAGSNNIVNLVHELGITLDWKCYDIDTSFVNNAPDYPIIQQDTIENFPKGFDVVITNPPYLAKNSATRRHLEYKYPEYDDLYKKCLEVMLYNCKYVAAIIPESFITSNLFHNRLFGVISLTCKMFDDTDCPVCLALFVPENLKTNNDKNDFTIYQLDKYIGKYSTLKQNLIFTNDVLNWKFNDTLGSIGILCVDNTQQESIQFVEGTIINSDSIKVSSRAFTRVSGLPDNVELIQFINMCNNILNDYRSTTNDVFLTSFKGLRKDGKYRRRLDFKTAKQIMNLAFLNLINNDFSVK